MGMKPIQVISLAENNEVRREHMRSEFAKQGITEYAFFDAVTRSQVHEVLEAWKLSLIPPPSDIYEPLTLGEMGCLLSHISLWRRMVEENMPYLIILEDDVFLGENFKRLLQTNYIPKRASIIKLETHYFSCTISKLYIRRVDGRRIFKLCSRHLGSGAYLITLSGAKFLLERLKDVPVRQVDQFLFVDLINRYSEYLLLQMVPAPCVQELIQYPDPSMRKLSSSLEGEMKARVGIEIARRENKPKLTYPQKLLREFKRIVNQIRAWILREKQLVIPFK